MARAIRLTLVKSMAGRPERQRAVLTGLGLTKMRKTVVRQDTPEIRGMVAKVLHLVQVEEMEAC
ncbi:MAG: 50S ribosomal protein L30 [Thermodesulfobacteriota bacterium]